MGQKLRSFCSLPDYDSPSHIASLAASVAKTDIDDAGTIDGTEVAAALTSIHTAVNAIIVALETAGIAKRA